MGAIEEITLSRRADLSRPPQGDDRHYTHRLNHPLLRSKVPVDFCMEAARLLLERPGRVLISTGFFQAQPFEQPVQGGTTEADGPAGAYALGLALEKLGSSATYVVDRYCMIPFIDLPGADDVVDFPIAGHEESRAFARKLLAERAADGGRGDGAAGHHGHGPVPELPRLGPVELHRQARLPLRAPGDHRHHRPRQRDRAAATSPRTRT